MAILLNLLLNIIIYIELILRDISDSKCVSNLRYAEDTRLKEDKQYICSSS